MDPFIWPGVFLFAVIFALVFFRKDLSDLIRRTREVSKTGIKADAPAQQLPSVAPEGVANKVDQMREFDNRSLLAQEKLIFDDMDRRGMKERTETVKLLVRHLAGTQLTVRYEWIDRAIWGSQIRLLMDLNSKPQGVARQDLLPFYEQAKESVPRIATEYTFDNYISFLEQNNLITSGPKPQITQLGKDYLQFLIHSGRTGTRPN